MAESHYGMRFNGTSRLDFDRGMLWYRGWGERMRNETTWGYSEDPPSKGMVRVQKYTSMEEIYAQYDDTWDMSKFASPIEGMADIDIDAITEEAYGDDIQF